jgi:bleomycin hydrolase
MRLILLGPLFILTSFCYGQKLSGSALGLTAPKIVNCTSVKDQYMSSTCWSFSSNSFLESELMKMGRGKFDLSEMFVARYSMLRKIRRHLLLKGQNFFTPGGQFHDVMWVIKNYGIVPESVYSGKVHGEFNHNHSEMDTIITRYVKDMLSSGVIIMNAAQQHFVDSVLDYYLGRVPKQFIYKGRAYTPQGFLKQVLKFSPDDYVEITSYTHHPFYKPFILEDKYNWTGDAYFNVTIEDFSRITDSALKNGYTVGWDGDADDPYFDFHEGLAYMPDTIKNFQIARQNAFEDHSTLLDHMMHIVSAVKDANGQKWYYIKNSWGDYSNSSGGFLFMRDDYLKIRTVAIIVNKEAIPAEIIKKLALKN